MGRPVTQNRVQLMIEIDGGLLRESSVVPLQPPHLGLQDWWDDDYYDTTVSLLWYDQSNYWRLRWCQKGKKKRMKARFLEQFCLIKGVCVAPLETASSDTIAIWPVAWFPNSTPNCLITVDKLPTLDPVLQL